MKKKTNIERVRKIFYNLYSCTSVSVFVCVYVHIGQKALTSLTRFLPFRSLSSSSTMSLSSSLSSLLLFLLLLLVDRNPCASNWRYAMYLSYWNTNSNTAHRSEQSIIQFYHFAKCIFLSGLCDTPFLYNLNCILICALHTQKHICSRLFLKSMGFNGFGTWNVDKRFDMQWKKSITADIYVRVLTCVNIKWDRYIVNLRKEMNIGSPEYLNAVD